MATTRQSIVRGPGTVAFNGVKLFDASGITAEVDSTTKEIPSSIAGTLDTIKTDQVGKISLTPIGNVSAEILATLFPSWIQKPVIGQSVFGSTDKPLVVSSMAGTKVTFNAAALTKCPDLMLSPVVTAFGGVEFTALLANGKLPNETGAFYAVTSAAYADGEPPRDNLSGFHYQGTFGSLTIPDTAAGWTVTVEPNLNPVMTDSQGTIDYTLGGVTVRARCVPLGLSESQILAALPVAKGRGASVATTDDLVISSSGGLTVTLKNAALVTGPIQWGTTQLRAGEIGFVAHVAADGQLFKVEMASAE